MKSTTQTRLSLQSNFAISDFPRATSSSLLYEFPSDEPRLRDAVGVKPVLPAPPKRHGSNPTGLKNESGTKGKQSYFDCIVPPTVGETDSTVAAAQAWATLATQINN